MMMKPPTAKPAPVTKRPLVAGLLLLSVVALAQKVGSKPVTQVWKTPGCSCCKDWLTHSRDNGLGMIAHDVEETMEARWKADIPERYASCHTSIVQGCALGGHAPARETKRLLQERPKAIGLAVSSMPLGAPGVGGSAYGNRRIPYNVLLIRLDG